MMRHDWKDWQVTPKHVLSDYGQPLKLGDKIEIFNERTDGWQLGIADRIVNGVIDHDGKNMDLSESAYAVLHIVFSYFETIAKYREGVTGRVHPSLYFMKGLMLVFPENGKDFEKYPELVKILWDGVRCGLYHSGCTDPSVFIDPEIEGAIGFTKYRKLKINPRILVLKLRENLRFYVERLLNPDNTQERENFEKHFDFLNGINPTTRDEGSRNTSAVR